MAGRSRQAALEEIQGAYLEQYKRIADYCSELLRANPGSSVTLKVQRSPDFEVEDQQQRLNNYCIFQRVYVCLAACKKSFLQCRKFLGLDVCFLKTPQGGQLLTAVGWDPNDQMLPIAYAVVEAETKDTWKWFLRLLIDDFGVDIIGKTTFMSDQQKGLLPAFDEVIPGVDHRFCVRHLYSNFRKKFSGLHLKQLMWRSAKATHWKEWEKEMQIIRTINVDAHRHLNAIPPRFWSRSRFNFHPKCDTIVNNMCESFNGAIVESREKPIVTILEDIRDETREERQISPNQPLQHPSPTQPNLGPGPHHPQLGPRQSPPEARHSNHHHQRRWVQPAPAKQPGLSPSATNSHFMFLQES
ncbi:uncharacterized protein [Arachis hypogaea]|uniref:uncharacterized protein n=1 Tax=Arachis hypogaea TaxID=3818 RepID=UPI003B225F0B